jgi:hypothetical protein
MTTLLYVYWWPNPLTASFYPFPRRSAIVSSMSSWCVPFQNTRWQLEQKENSEEFSYT